MSGGHQIVCECCDETDMMRVGQTDGARVSPRLPIHIHPNFNTVSIEK